MKTKNAIMLALTAFIWGVAFVAQSVGMDYVGPFTFNAVRCILGAVVLVPCILFFDSKKEPEARQQENKKVLITGGVLCGTILCIASNLQQIGIQYTTVGKAGFITAMYIIIVPILGVFVKKKTGIKVWISVLMAVAGMYLLCMTESLVLSKGDAFVLACAVIFSLHILVIDYFSPKADGVKMSCIQFLVCGLLSAVMMCIFEKPSAAALWQVRIPILYSGIMSCGVAYTLQIVGQKGMSPTISSLILSLESVFSVLAGWVILHQTMLFRELAGCVIMFAAIILAQLPEKSQKTENEKNTKIRK